jgi:hypothetical protein
MARRPASSRLDRALDRGLRGFARLGAVVVAALTVGARTRRGRETAQALETRFAQADRLVARHSAGLDPLLTRAAAWLDRLLSRWLS